MSALRLYGVVASLLFAGAAAAQGMNPALQRVYDNAGIDEHLGEYVPGDIRLTDHTGVDVSIADYLETERPVILNFVYFDCPMLCSVVLDGLARSLAAMDWAPGSQFEVLTVSISPADTPELASEARARYAAELGKPEAMSGWHFLTGSEPQIRRLADAVGFKYAWVEEAQQYVHPAVLTVLAPDGKVTRYLYGIDYPERTVRNAIVEASNGEIGSPLDRLIMFCLQYSPSENAYVIHATNVMRVAGLLTVIALLALFAVLRRQDRRHSAAKLTYS